MLASATWFYTPSPQLPACLPPCPPRARAEIALSSALPRISVRHLSCPRKQAGFWVLPPRGQDGRQLGVYTPPTIRSAATSSFRSVHTGAVVGLVGRGQMAVVSRMHSLGRGEIIAKLARRAASVSP
jgi:hypothetical protein